MRKDKGTMAPRYQDEDDFEYDYGYEYEEPTKKSSSGGKKNGSGKKASSKGGSKKKMSAKARAKKKRKRILLFVGEVLLLAVMLLVLWGVTRTEKVGYLEIPEEEIVVNEGVNEEQLEIMKGYRDVEYGKKTENHGK